MRRKTPKREQRQKTPTAATAGTSRASGPRTPEAPASEEPSLEIAPPPAPETPLSAERARLGPTFAPQMQLRLYSPDEWERFIEEWAFYSVVPRYIHVRRFGGPRDRGIDIAGFTDTQRLRGVWDCYQCKRYTQGPLSVSQVLPDIGKVLWYTFREEYRAPRKYFFMSPHGPTTDLAGCLGDPNSLRARVLEQWSKGVRTKITDTQSVELTGRLRRYVATFDFSIFDAAAPLELVEQHRSCPYHTMRFGGALPPRPRAQAPPLDISLQESRYVAQLLAAYGDHKRQPLRDPGALKAWPRLQQHFSRQREAFYKADSLRVFSRDTVPPGTYEALEEEIFSGVIDTHDMDYPDGFERVLAVTRSARQLAITANALIACSDGTDRTGICHHLANKDRLRWTVKQ